MIGYVRLQLIQNRLYLCRELPYSRNQGQMNKRDLVLNVINPSTRRAGIPAAFFLHFDPVFHRGRPAVEKHLEFFRKTDMDFVKIQYENVFPRIPEMTRPEDWARMPLYKEDFYEEQLKVVEGLIKAAKSEALIVVTLYSPFMCAGHTAGADVVTQHIKDDPQAVKKGMQIITESLMLFVKSSIKLGVDGFYHSTQGGEAYRFQDMSLFDECIRPYDLALMDEINARCIFNILHICDYTGVYRDLTPYLDYPGHVVNTSLQLKDRTVTAREVAELFGRPFMGGLDRHGVLVHGTKEEIRSAVRGIASEAPDQFILGADCTVPNDIDWENLRTAIDAAHSFRA